MTMYELCRKSVIDLSTGANLGRVDDLAFDDGTAAVTHIILYGKPKWFGLLGRAEDTAIPWQAVRKVGTDVLLVQGADAPDVRHASVPKRRLALFGGT